MRVTLEMAAACITICTVWLLLLGAVELHAACVRECMSLQPAAFRPELHVKRALRPERRGAALAMPRPAAAGARPNLQFLGQPIDAKAPSWSKADGGRMPP